MRSDDVVGFRVKPLLFKKLSLQNFGIHVATDIHFSEQSAITILTGANGSGKTMVVEALQLVLGFTPKTPRRRSGQATYVAENAEHALIDLVLFNPTREGERLITSSKPRLREVLDADEITIRLKINKDGTSQHYLVTNKGKGLGRPISKEELRELLRRIDINTKNMLVFTEEGTITEFAKKTPLMRFRTFLEVTGLAEYHDEMSQLRAEITSFQEKLKPLKERISIEQKRAQILEQRASEYKEKLKLISQLEDMQRQYQWVEVIVLEQREQEIKEILDEQRFTMKSLLNEQRSLINALQHLKEERTELEHNVELLETKLMTIDTKLGELSAKKEQALKTLKKEEENIKELKQKKTKIIELLETKNDPKLNERLQQLRMQLQELETKQQEVDQRIRLLESEMNELNQQLKAAGKQPSRRNDQRIKSRPTDYESRLLRAAKTMRNAVKREDPNLSHQLVGPVFNLIRLKKGEERWEGAVKRLCGRHLYSFIAMSRDVYERVKSIYDHLDPKVRSHVEVARYEPHDADSIYKEPLQNLPPEIHDWAINVLEGDSACLWWLSKNLNSLLAENTINPNVATDVAIRHKVHIITEDENSYYLPKGAFSGPPAPMMAPLGKTLEELEKFDHVLEEDIQDIRERLSTMREEYHQAREERLHLLEERSKIKELLKEISKGEEEIQIELSNLELNIKKSIEEMQNAQDQIKLLEEELHDLEEQKESLTNNKKILTKNLKNTERQVVMQEKRLEELTTSVNAIEEKINALEDEYDEIQDLLDQKLREVLSRYPEKPSIPMDELPTVEDLQKEIAVLSARINQIKATEKDEEEYLRQLGKIDELKNYLEERETHLSGLLDDLDKRLSEWKDKLLTVINAMGKNMNELLGYKYEVSLRIKKIHQINHTELEIMVRERLSSHDDEHSLLDERSQKSGKWRDLSQLSGGEKQLVAEAFFLALHLTVNTPLHAIDEFTQRLDRDNIGLVLGMVLLASEISTRNAPYRTQFLLISPELEGYQLDPSIKLYTFAPVLTSSRRRVAS